MWHEFRQGLKGRIANSRLRIPRKLEVLGDLLEFGRWRREHESPVALASRDELYCYINDELLRSGPVDFLEFGVYTGSSLRKWLKLNGDPESRFFGFDSFEGLPEDWQSSFRQHFAKGTFDLGGKAPDLEDGRVTLVKGLFQDTLPGFLAGFRARNRILVHIDADLYTSTLYLLATLDRCLAPGSLLMFDEFTSLNHEFRAFRDYSRSFRRKHRFVAASPPFYLVSAIELLE